MNAVRVVIIFLFLYMVPPGLASGDSLRFAPANTQPIDPVLGDLIDAEADYGKTGNDRKALIHLLRIVKYRKISRNIQVQSRALADLADVSARLKLYPLAMKCYGQSVSWKPEEQPDSLPVTAQDTSERPLGQVSSKPIDGEDIWMPFEDGKTGVSYALLIHIKQPIPGKPKSFTHINNVGHTFITLIKYNTDNTYVSRSFGFYPHKRNFFAATPIHPSSASMYKNDSLHDWDEAVGKFISYRKFQRIIRLIKRYNLREYDLNLNNCTNFGLNVALVGGISIQDARGRWPLGTGSNPGNAGQSILEGKVLNVDDGYGELLFISRSAALAGTHP
jgi:hypothetical protein